MIKSFRHRGVEKFFRTGSDNAKQPGDMNAPGWKLHSLAGEFNGHWAVSVSGNWRLTFKFEGEEAVLVNYQDYH